MNFTINFDKSFKFLFYNQIEFIFFSMIVKIQNSNHLMEDLKVLDVISIF